LVDNATVAILPSSSPATPGYPAADAIDTGANQYLTDYASSGQGSSTHLDFQFPTPETFTGITYTNRTTSGGPNNSFSGGTFDYVYKYEYIFSNDPTFATNVGIVTITNPNPGSTFFPEVANFQSSDAIPSITGQYMRWQVLQYNGNTGNTGAADFEFFANNLTTFSALSSPSIVYGTSTTTLTGHIGFFTAYPTGSSVSITLNSVTQTATVDGGGNFTTTFDTSTLGVAGGPYTVTYAFAGNTNFSAAADTSTAVTVTKAASTTVTAGADPFTYDGTTHAGGSGTVTGAGGLSTAATSLTYSAHADGSGTADRIDAGTYYVTAHYAGDANHNPSDGAAVAISIGKASSTTMTVGAGPFTYDGTTQAGGSGTVTGAGGLSTVATSVTYSAHADGSGTADQIDAGTYYVTAHYAGDANHFGSDGSPVAISIGKASSTTVTVGAGPFTYNGTPQAGGSGTVSGGGGLSTVATSVTYSAHADGSGTPDQIDAGTYYVTAHYAGDANHFGSDGSAVSISIGKASSTTTTIGAGPFVYDGTTHLGGSGTVTGAGGLSTVATSVTYSANANGTGTADQIDAGTYYVTAHYAGDANHLASNGAATAVVITPKLLAATAASQATINIGSNGSIVLHLAVAAGQLYGTDTVASLFSGAIFTIGIQNADGSVTYGTLTSTATVESDGSITVSMRMSDTLKADLYDAYVSGREVNLEMTATANGGNYALDADTMSRLLNHGAFRFIP
jgi:hypothetical protein